MKNLSNWRSVRMLESRLERELRRRHSLRLHGLCIGLVTMGLMWGVSHLQMVMGMESLAWRYLITLGSGYLAYLLVIRLWAAQLLGRDKLARTVVVRKKRGNPGAVKPDEQWPE